MDAHTHVVATLWELNEAGIRLFYANARAREVFGVDPAEEPVYLCDIAPEAVCAYSREMIRIANTGHRVSEVRHTPYGTMFVEGTRIGRWILYLAYELQELADEMGDFIEAQKEGA